MLFARQDPDARHLAVWVVRTTGDPRQALPTIQRVLREADPSVGIRFAASGRELLAEPLARPRLLAAVLALLAAVSVLLAAVGLFGVLAALVRQRAHEIAIRLALGATPAGVRALVLREAARLAGAGLLVGVALALAGTRTLRTVLFDVSPPTRSRWPGSPGSSWPWPRWPPSCRPGAPRGSIHSPCSGRSEV